jgi:CheY-like chemotaxis protein
LLVEDDASERRSIAALVADDDDASDVETVSVATGEDALAALEKEPFDCLVVDLVLPALDGFNLIEKVRANPRTKDVPIVVYTGKDLSREEEVRLKKQVESLIVKSGGQSHSRLLHDTAVFLHRVDRRAQESAPVLQGRGSADAGAHAHPATPAPSTPAAERRSAEPRSAADKQPVEAHAGLVRPLADDRVLLGRKVLVVDDDVRNIFALTSVLESHGLEVIYAENGRAALEKLESTPDIDVVLMDIMMPEMDGYQTMRRIRTDARFASLPIIAVTAKALKDDRERCIEAGASDYLPKPIENERLIDLVRMWVAPRGDEA